MKTKISISVSKELIEKVNMMSENYKNRSAFIESAINSYIKEITNSEKNKNDVNIINKNAKRLNKEALDVLSYQGFS
jgi:metal-responsive CopG/Arc/MetJ family transcriptional regulator